MIRAAAWSVSLSKSCNPTRRKETRFVQQIERLAELQSDACWAHWWRRRPATVARIQPGWQTALGDPLHVFCAHVHHLLTAVDQLTLGGYQHWHHLHLCSADLCSQNYHKFIQVSALVRPSTAFSPKRCGWSIARQSFISRSLIRTCSRCNCVLQIRRTQSQGHYMQWGTVHGVHTKASHTKPAHTKACIQIQIDGNRPCTSHWLQCQHVQTRFQV